MLTRLVNTSNTSKYVLSLQTHQQQRFQNSMVTEAFSYLTFDSTENTSLVAQTVTNLPAMEETWFQPLGQEYLLEKGMATHSSILAWKIPWTEEPGKQGGFLTTGPPGSPPSENFSSMPAWPT